MFDYLWIGLYINSSHQNLFNPTICLNAAILQSTIVNLYFWHKEYEMQADGSFPGNYISSFPSKFPSSLYESPIYYTNAQITSYADYSGGVA